MNDVNNLKVVVVGCGGLGGFVIEGLSRMGVKKIKLVDFDKFDSTNMNRQLFCTQLTLDKSKSQECKSRLAIINPNIEADAINEKLDNQNISKMIECADVVFDCVDNIETKLLLEDYCVGNNIALIHGAVNGFYGQVALIKDKPVLAKLYQNNNAIKQENEYYGPCTVGGLMVSMFRKWTMNEPMEFDCYMVDIYNFRIEGFLFNKNTL